MDNTVKVATIALCLMALLDSCVNKVGCDAPDLPYQVLTESIKRWLPYASDTEIYFTDSNANSDTIRLRNFFAGDDNIWRGDECGFGRGQFVRANFIDSKSKDTIRTEIEYKTSFSTSRKSTFVTYRDEIQNVALPTLYRRYEKTKKVNDKTFEDCIWVECVSSDNCIQTGITKYFFAKGKGLVAYERNNVLWTLTK